MINKVTLIGHLGKDPEIRHLEGGVSVVKFTLATNESYRDKSGEWQTLTEWHDIVAWRLLAEKAAKDFHKGSLVYVEGKITHRKWQDKEGQDRYSTEIVANTLRGLDKKEYSGPPRQFGDVPGSEAPPAVRNDYSSKEAQQDDDDLPF